MTNAFNHRQHTAPTRGLSPTAFVIVLVVGVISP
jgi:hypothetical protein